MGIQSFGLKTIGIKRAKIGSFSWLRYWKSQDEVLFFAETKDIADGKLYNQKSGSSDYLTVTGAAGSYTFQCPDTAPYIAADTDYIWFSEVGVQRTTTEAELIGYDLQRTPVKYDDTNPYSIRAIIILKAGETLSDDKVDKLHRDLYLPVYWSGVANWNGHLKDNRGAYQQLFEGYDDASYALFSRMAIVLDSPPSARKTEIDTRIKALKSGRNLWAKTLGLWVTASHGRPSAKLNWKQDAFNLDEVGTLTFTTDRGFTGDASTGALRPHFNPSTDGGILYTLNDATVGHYSRSDNISTIYKGDISAESASEVGVIQLVRDLNGTGQSIHALHGVRAKWYTGITTDGLHISTRVLSTHTDIYRNKTLVAHFASASSALPNEEMYFGCRNVTGSGLLQFNNKEYAIFIVGLGWTIDDVEEFYDIMVDGYLTALGANV